MSVIGLLMVSHEDDILGSVLMSNARLVDAYYVLDGTVPNAKSRRMCEHHVNCCGYWHDSELPKNYGERPRDDWREFLLQAAYADWGHDNWFLLLHGDEVWTVDPRKVVAEPPGRWMASSFRSRCTSRASSGRRGTNQIQKIVIARELLR